MKGTLVLILLITFSATGAALAAEPADAPEPMPETATPAAETAPDTEATLCGGPLFGGIAAPALAETGEPLDQAVEGSAALCQRCPIGVGTCDGYPYCYVGNDCCCPLKGICNCVCW
jgi:hypothetical protein